MTRIVFVASFVANVMLALVSLAILPERVAIHFGWGGMPDQWASKETHALTLLGLETCLFLILCLLPRLAGAIPARWVNLPNKPFWLAPENRARFQAKCAALIHRFGTALFFFLFAFGLHAIQANLAQPVRLQQRSLFVFLAMFVAYAIGWCIAFFRAFRVPKEPSAGGHPPENGTHRYRPR